MRAQGTAPGTRDPGARHNSTGYVRSVTRQTRRAPCPVCNKGSRDTALSVTADQRGTVSYCFRCGYKASEQFERFSASSPRIYTPWQGLAEYLWSQSLPITGTPAETYLKARDCRLPPEDGDVRYLPARGKHPHALLACITDTVTAESISLHFTRLAPDGRGKAGSQHDKLLLGRHRKTGGVIRLWPDESVTNGLAVSEGIESGLCAAHAFTPVWAAIDASNLASFPVLAGIEGLLIVADNDVSGSGQRAARECARRWHSGGCDVRIALSLTAGNDAADEVAV
jgi:putative DNA primase/helicase